MRTFVSIKLNDVNLFKTKLTLWTKKFKYASILNSNNYYDNYTSKHFYNKYDLIAGIGKTSEFIPKNEIFKNLNSYKNKTKDWLFGYFTYDLKNQIEDLESNNIDNQCFPEVFFFSPKYVFLIKGNYLKIGSNKKNNAINIYNQILKTKIRNSINESEINIKQRISKNKYFKTVEAIKKNIKNGDIYELTYCIDFYDDNAKINPQGTFEKLIKKSPTPFSAYFNAKNNFLICASPERYLKKEKNKIVSQPIKGTIKKSKDLDENKILATNLLNDEKEKAENVMITDLVRNDLSITAKKNSVKVNELFGIYEFPQVFQMISTISCKKSEKHSSIDVIKNSFPMGSMTGAPKIKAMQLIEKYEETKRGLFSGAVGYFDPQDNFDFNVVIRSILYNSKLNYLSFNVGSAITYKSITHKEYDECLLKAKAISEILNINLLK